MSACSSYFLSLSFFELHPFSQTNKDTDSDRQHYNLKGTDVQTSYGYANMQMLKSIEKKINLIYYRRSEATTAWKAPSTQTLNTYQYMAHLNP